MMILLLALIGLASGATKRLIPSNVLTILKSKPYTINCNEISLKGSTTGVRRWETVKSTYIKERTRFEYVFRIPADSKLWEVKRGVLAKCKKYLKLGNTTITLMNEWSAWDKCDITKCKETRYRPCAAGQCPSGKQEQERMCEDNSNCFGPCYIVQAPTLTEQSDIVLSWSIEDECTADQSRVKVTTDGSVQYLQVVANTTTVQFPYNSQKDYQVEMDLQGKYKGLDSDIVSTIDVSETTFDFNCVKRTSEETFDFTCEYNAMVRINISINGLLQGDYIGKGSIKFVEIFCDENKNVNFTAKSNSGEEIHISETLPAKNSRVKCNSEKFLPPNEVSGNDAESGNQGNNASQDGEKAGDDVIDEEKVTQFSTITPTITKETDEKKGDEKKGEDEKENTEDNIGDKETSKVITEKGNNSGDYIIDNNSGGEEKEKTDNEPKIGEGEEEEESFIKSDDESNAESHFSSFVILLTAFLNLIR